MNGAPFDFIGWSFYDAVELRHEFYDTFSVNPSNTVVLYGGRVNNDPAPPTIPGASAPFSEGVAGVSVLNDGGDTIRLYNYDGNLVTRVVYTKATSADGISWTRFPTLTNDFVEHNSVVCTNASPGLQPDQTPYSAGPSFWSPPTITGIAEQIVRQGSASSPIAFTVGDPVDPAGNLTLAGQSDNSALVPNQNVAFGGSGASRTVTVTPAPGQSGLSIISITVGNSHLRCANTNFLFAATPTNNPPPLFSDNFNYPNGSIITNSGFVWTNHSGTVGEMQVTNYQLQVTDHQSEDVHAIIPGGPYPTGSGALYYSFTVNFVELPTPSGSILRISTQTPRVSAPGCGPRPRTRPPANSAWASPTRPLPAMSRSSPRIWTRTPPTRWS